MRTTKILYTGIVDGWQNPQQLDVGMTYDCEKKQDYYDRAVNIAQVSRLFLGVLFARGKVDHTSIH